ncbi:MAG: rhomboid family intramembrane serine protease [Pseudomonadales bacterium]
MPQFNPDIRVLEVPLEDDLGEFSRYLRDAGITHRFHEEAGKQVLVVTREDHAGLAREAYDAYRSGRLEIRPATPRRRRVDTRQLLLIWQRMPVSSSLIVLCVVLFPVTWGDSPTLLLRLLAFSDFQIVDEYLRWPDFGATMLSGQIWRLWTPALLHFGALHLIFNMLVLWLLAPRIEIATRGRRLITVVMIIAPVSNCAQYFFSSWPLFGGMSGVVYGLLGYLLVAQRYLPHPMLRVPPSITGMLLVSLVLFSLGVLELFDIRVANAAHWSGLGSGLGLGALFTWRDRRSLLAREALGGDGE